MIFSTFFDDFEVFEFLDGPRSAREALGGRLGRVLGVLGGSGGRLGRVLGGLGVISERFFEQSDFGSIFP